MDMPYETGTRIPWKQMLFQYTNGVKIHRAYPKVSQQTCFCFVNKSNESETLSPSVLLKVAFRFASASRRGNYVAEKKRDIRIR